MHRQQVGSTPAGSAKNNPPPGGSHGNGDVIRNEEEGSTGMYGIPVYPDVILSNLIFTEIVLSHFLFIFCVES